VPQALPPKDAPKDEHSLSCGVVGCFLQGLADTFLLLGLPFDSSEAAQLNKEIFECIYFAGEPRHLTRVTQPIASVLFSHHAM
jgi:hypothetical protein